MDALLDSLLEFSCLLQDSSPSEFALDAPPSITIQTRWDIGAFKTNRGALELVIRNLLTSFIVIINEARE